MMTVASADSSFRINAGDSLGHVFLRSALEHTDRTALDVAGTSLTYGELRDLAGRIARLLSEVPRSAPVLGAVIGSRGPVAYAGVLATLLSGAGYVPLNPKFPDDRSLYMLEASGSATLIADRSTLDRLPALLSGVSRALTVILADMEDVSELARTHPRHRFLGKSDVVAATPIASAPGVDKASIAYLMFTSGSTGRPKGVMVSHGNALHHMDVMWKRYGVTADDRVSHAFDLTFDLSVFDMFVAWGRGASLHVIPTKEQIAPAKFIAGHGLTIWFSVPSVGVMLQRLRLLKPGAFPTLRWSLFCGERLPMEVAQAWAEAAPSSIVENLYGPTEVTIACTLYRWDRQHSPAACVDGGVPIGVPYEGMAAAVVDDELAIVPRGAKGELCMRGPQLAAGYWHDVEKTNDRFVRMPWDGGPENRWYRTGDVAYVDGNGDLIHCGRNDDQIKLRGFRIELQEINHVLAECAAAQFAVVIPWPLAADGPSGLVAFVATSAVTDADMLSAAKRRLPEYMIPNEVVRMDRLPLNDNGKTDKNQLRRLLEERNAEHR